LQSKTEVGIAAIAVSDFALSVFNNDANLSSFTDATTD
jgi:hypothetical protein